MISLKGSRRKSTATVPREFTGQERIFADSLVESIDSLAGRRGEPIDRAVTFRDLLDANVLSLAAGQPLSNAGGVNLVNPLDPTTSVGGGVEIPPAPSIQIIGGFGFVRITWVMPVYRGAAYLEIYRSQTDLLSTAVSAGPIVRYSGSGSGFYDDRTVGEGTTYYYWARGVNINEVAGPFNLSAGTSGTTPLNYIYVSGLIDDILADAVNALGLNTVISGVTGDISSINADIAGITASIIVINGDISSINADITGINTDIGNIESDITALNAINTWDSAVTYAVADLVTYQNYIWEAALASTNQAPAAGSTYWTQVGSYARLVDFVSATQGQNSSTRATLTSDYYTKTDANSAITASIDAYTSAVTGAGGYTSDANATTIIYTKADADSATTAAIDAYTSAVTGTGGYTSAANANTVIYTKADADSATTAAIDAYTSAVTGTGGYTSDANATTIIYTKADADSAITSEINDFASAVTTPAGYTDAGVTTIIYAKADADSAISTALNTYTTTIGANTATLQQTAESLNGTQAKYSVKIDNNNHVSGFGLISTANDATPYSTFVVASDAFGISAPTTANSATDTAVGVGYPFKVITTPTTINGEVIPAGTYINDAFIHNAQITSATIGVGTITTANITEGAITSASIADSIYSANWFASGNSGAASGVGWNINSANGYAFFQNIVCKGIIQATALILSAGAEVRTLQIAGNAVTVPTFITFTFPAYSVNSSNYSTPVDASGNATARTYVRASGGRLLVTCVFGVKTNTTSDSVTPNLYAKLKVGNSTTQYNANLGSSETHVSVPQNGSTEVNIRVTATLAVTTSSNHGTADADENYETTPTLLINGALSLSAASFSTYSNYTNSAYFGDPNYQNSQMYQCKIIHPSNPAIFENVQVTNRAGYTFMVYRGSPRQEFPNAAKLTYPAAAFANDRVSIELQVSGNNSQLTACNFTVISCKR